MLSGWREEEVTVPSTAATVCPGPVVGADRVDAVVGDSQYEIFFSLFSPFSSLSLSLSFSSLPSFCKHLHTGSAKHVEVTGMQVARRGAVCLGHAGTPPYLFWLCAPNVASFPGTSTGPWFLQARHPWMTCGVARPHCSEASSIDGRSWRGAMLRTAGRTVSENLGSPS